MHEACNRGWLRRIKRWGNSKAFSDQENEVFHCGEVALQDLRVRDILVPPTWGDCPAKSIRSDWVFRISRAERPCLWIYYLISISAKYMSAYVQNRIIEWNKRPKYENCRYGVFYPLSLLEFGRLARCSIFKRLPSCRKVPPYTVVLLWL